MPGPPVEGGGRGWLARPIATKGQNAAFIRCQNASAGPSAGAAIGASLGGTRVFTATNAQGLLFMAEHLYTASGSRRPIVMAVVSSQVVYWWLTENDSRNTLERQATAVERMFREQEAARP